MGTVEVDVPTPARGTTPQALYARPDRYFLNGQACTGMGYRESTDNIDIVLQTVICRQYIYGRHLAQDRQHGLGEP